MLNIFPLDMFTTARKELSVIHEASQESANTTMYPFGVDVRDPRCCYKCNFSGEMFYKTTVSLACLARSKM